jgi:hypothetical protein
MNTAAATAMRQMPDETDDQERNPALLQVESQTVEGEQIQLLKSIRAILVIHERRSLSSLGLKSLASWGLVTLQADFSARFADLCIGCRVSCVCDI